MRRNRFKVIQFGCASSHMHAFCCKKLNMALVNLESYPSVFHIPIIFEFTKNVVCFLVLFA